MKIKSKLGAKIKEQRLKSGYTQDELAAYVGVKRQTISSWEVGRTEPDFQQTITLSKLFGCSVEELVSDLASKIHTISMYDDLTDENRALVDDFIKMLYDKQNA